MVQVRHDCSPLELRRALLSIHRRILREAAQGSGLSYGDEEAAQAAAEHVAQQEQRQEQKQQKQRQTAAREDVDDAAMPAAKAAAAVRQVFRFCKSQASKPYWVGLGASGVVVLAATMWHAAGSRHCEHDARGRQQLAYHAPGLMTVHRCAGGASSAPDAAAAQAAGK